MARPKHTTPTVMKNIALPGPLVEKLELHLFSQVEGKIPLGAHKEFFTSLLNDYFARNASPCRHCMGTGVAL